MHRRLHNLYYGLPRDTAYAGANNLLWSTRQKYSEEKVLGWLESQDAYNLHKQVRRRFSRCHYNVRNIDDVWGIDLIDMKSIKTYNDNYAHVLAVIDVLSKYAWVVPIKDKSAQSVVEAFEKIFNSCDKRITVCVPSKKKMSLLIVTFSFS